MLDVTWNLMIKDQSSRKRLCLITNL